MLSLVNLRNKALFVVVNGGSSPKSLWLLLLPLYLEPNNSSTSSFFLYNSLLQSEDRWIWNWLKSLLHLVDIIKDDFWLGFNFTSPFKTHTFSHFDRINRLILTHAHNKVRLNSLSGDYALRNLLAREISVQLLCWFYLFSRMHGSVHYTVDFGIRILKIEPLHHYISSGVHSFWVLLGHSQRTRSLLLLHFESNWVNGSSKVWRFQEEWHYFYYIHHVIAS